MRLARVLGGLGRVLITAGVLILLFVAYQLWGTGIREAQAQNELEDQFARLLEGHAVRTFEDPAVSTTTTSVASRPATEEIEVPPVGEALARLVIPDIGVDKIVVEGVSLSALKKGPGHYPGTPLPGQMGNAAIAGHRTTYGAPFNRIDELEPGDEIIVETLQGRFRYEMREQLIVAPSDVWVLDQPEATSDENLLTLTACHPEYSARQRIVVVAELGPGEPVFPHPRRGEAMRVQEFEDLDGEDASIWPAVVLGVVCALIWLVTWLIGRRWRRLPAYLVGTPVFLVALFFFFENFSRLLPPNF